MAVTAPAARSRALWRATALAIAVSTLIGMVLIVVGPWFRDTTTYGFHDWDAVGSFRYLVKISLLEHHEWPSWDPYACGGYPSWGYVEGATNLVSPWLPAYLVLPFPLAIRVEVVGMGLLGAFGAYALGSCFTKSHGARLLIAALWAVNGRWGLQVASGHSWHLAYAYLPWCFFFFERARGEERRLRDLVMLGVCFAAMVYAGGIYPLPHTVLALSSYATILAVAQRRFSPLWVLAQGGLLGIALAAPKLLPMLDTFASDPRLIASNERLDLGSFVTLLTSRDQTFSSRPARVYPYGWHEWGMYIGPVGMVLLGYGVLFAGNVRARAFSLTGLLLLVLGFGAFHPMAPWTLLHKYAPVFQSQHVPSRFLYPAVLMLAVAAAAMIGRYVDKRRRRLPWLDTALCLAVTLLAVDIAKVSRLPMRQAMVMVAPDIPTGREFHHAKQPPFQYKRRDWAGPTLLAMMGNTGVLNCYGVPRDGWSPAPVAKTKTGYRGMLWLDGPGSIERLSWSPSEVRVRLHDVSPGTQLVYNMNHRRGWSASAGQLDARDGLVAVAVPGDGEITLRYRPPRFGFGLAICGLAIAGLLLLWRRRRVVDAIRPAS